jgi:hypothetical protein
MRSVEADGMADFDFPPLDRQRAISSFGDNAFAVLVRSIGVNRRRMPMAGAVSVCSEHAMLAHYAFGRCLWCMPWPALPADSVGVCSESADACAIAARACASLRQSVGWLRRGQADKTYIEAKVGVPATTSQLSKEEMLNQKSGGSKQYFKVSHVGLSHNSVAPLVHGAAAGVAAGAPGRRHAWRVANSVGRAFTQHGMQEAQSKPGLPPARALHDPRRRRQRRPKLDRP